jgi:recombination protein RecA
MSAAFAPVSFAADVAVRRPPQRTISVPGVKPASALEVRPAPDMVPFGISALDALTGGVPRGALTEITGNASAGRTSITMSLMTEITRRQEVCALIDASDSFDPASAEAAGVDLERVLWVRCGSSKIPTCQTPVTEKQDKPIPPAPRVERKSMAKAHEAYVPQAITETSRIRQNPTSMAAVHRVAPPAKNVSWSIHENYDARLRHAFTKKDDSERVWHSPSAVLPRASREAQVAARPRNFAAERAAKWNRLDQVLKATDLLIQSGGFGLIIIDLGDIPGEQARRIPLTSWFRFRRAVENTPTILLVIARDTCAKTCASLVLNLVADPQKSGESWPEKYEPRITNHEPLTHVSLLDGLRVHVELARTRLERKPVQSAGTHLQTVTTWKRTG